ncbi:putative ferric-chelate reductase 1 homolog [Ochlerotatus camptorhynchus]|uniref:putative ferric-chelate reductase 1 homolog n=1 Tax=Ochlerotatus camptorhynchus TaxID=644619 RepID=UPI0031DDB23B
MVKDIDLPDSTVLIKFHGTFMIIAWILFSSVGGTVARYFKKTWVSERYFGGDAWFLYHRVYTFFTWLLTCCGFILIFIDMDGWQDHAHAVVGLIAFILCFLQPIFGAVNPPENARKIVRMVHVVSGHLAYILAVTNMFLAVGMSTAKLPDSMYGLLGAAVGFHCVIHAMFNFLEYKSMKRGLPEDPTKDASFSRWRKVTLMAQMIGLFAVTVALVVLVWLA